MRISKEFILVFFILILNSKDRLIEFAFNKYSQFGEDGVISKIFECIGTTNKLCIDFGAYDGVFFSNTANLWLHNNWQALLIESDKKRYEKLLKNSIKATSGCITLNLKIEPWGDNSIDSIFSKLKLDEPIDLLSLDIDGNEYYILKNMKIRPRVIVVEFNPTLPLDAFIHQPLDGYFGCSQAALESVLGDDYKLVAITDCNCFFVHSKCVKMIEEKFETNRALIKNENYQMVLSSTYDGKTFLLSRKNLFPWGNNNKYIGEVVAPGYKMLPVSVI
jgi:hypothetical protein